MIGGNIAACAVIDLEGDGYSELVVVNSRSSVISFRYGAPSTETYSESLSGLTANRVQSGNFSGHGGNEIMIAYSNAKVHLKGTYCDVKGDIINGNIHLLDFNGNGKTDLYIVNNGYYYIYEYNNATNTIDLIKSASAAGLTSEPYIGDFNGDGISDLIWKYNDFFKIAIGTGNGFATPVIAPMFSGSNITIRDLNGDGKDDILCFNSGSTQAYYYLSAGYYDGQLFFIPQAEALSLLTTGEGNSISGKVVGDFNKDHKTDLIIFKYKNSNNSNHYSVFNFQGGNIEPLVSQVTDGLGHITKLTYVPFYAFSFDYANFRKNPVYCMLPATVELSNGISNAFNKYEYFYGEPYFSYRRKAFLGFKNFYINDLAAEKNSTAHFELVSGKEILKPVSEFVYWATTHLEKRVAYDSRIFQLPNSYIQYNHTFTTFDLLTDSKQEIATRLRSDGRIDSLITTVYETPTSYNHLTKEKKKFNYTSTTLYNGIIRPRITSEITSSVMWPSMSSPVQTVTYTYSGGRLSNINESNADGAISTAYSNYNNFGLPQTKTVSAAGCTSRTETTQYDATGRFPVSVTNALNQAATYTYNAATGKILTATDINGLTTAYQYDAFGRLISTTFPGGRIQTIAYKWNITGSLGNARHCTVTKEPGKPDITVYYDLLNREVYRGVKGYWTETVYDNTGRATHLSLPYTAVANRVWRNTYTYDGHGRIVSETAPYSSISYQYTPGNITTHDLLRGVSSARSYDAAGRTVSATDSGGTVNYTYLYITDNGKVRELTTINTNGSITSITNDQWGNRLKLIDPDAGTSTYTFNKFNELISQTDARGNTLTYQYDKLGRISQKGYTESGTPKTIAYLYDTYTTSNRGKGQLSSVTIDGVASESYTYDTLGRLQQEDKIIDNVTYTQNYGYNSDNQLETVSYPGGFAIRYEYDNNGDLYSIKQNDNNALIYRASKRNPLGQATRVTFGNGLASACYYDSYGTVTTLTTGNKVLVETPPVIIKPFGMQTGEDTTDVTAVTLAGLPFTEQDYITDNSVQYLTYTYNNYGLMTLRKDVKHNQCEQFTYDKLDRLTSHTAGACSGSFAPQYYGYDNTGNITFSPQAGNYTYGSGNNRPHAVDSVSLRPEYPEAIAASECCVLYDAFNMPVSITEGINRMNIFYNAARERCKTLFTAGSGRGAPSKTKYFISSLFEKEKGTSPNFERELSYIYAGNRLIAIFVQNNGTSEQKMYYIHQDHLGSYDVITTDNKAVSERHHFDPWGNRRNPTNWLATDTRTSFLFDRGFTGHEHLDKFNIINMNARLYDPVIGRFFSPDPYVQTPEFTQGFNRYSYCLNNPLRYVDPSGKTWVTRVVDGITEVYYDRSVKNQADVDNKYGAKSGIRHIVDGSTLTVRMGDEITAKYTFYNDNKINWYGTVRDMNGNLMDNSKIIYGLTYTIFGTTDESCNAETLHKNWFNTSYTGPDNPLDYLKEDSYQYAPRNMSEYPSIIHDLQYGNAKAERINGALFNTSVWKADMLLSISNMLLVNHSNAPLLDKARSWGTSIAFGIIATYKATIQGINDLYNHIFNNN